MFILPLSPLTTNTLKKFKSSCSDIYVYFDITPGPSGKLVFLNLAPLNYKTGYLLFPNIISKKQNLNVVFVFYAPAAKA